MKLNRFSKDHYKVVIVTIFVVFCLASPFLYQNMSLLSNVIEVKIPSMGSKEIISNGGFTWWSNDTRVYDWDTVNGTSIYLFNNPSEIYAILNGTNPCIIDQGPFYSPQPYEVKNKTIDFSFRFRSADQNRSLIGRAIIQYSTSDNQTHQVTGIDCISEDEETRYWYVAFVRAEIPEDVTQIIWRIEISSADGLPFSVHVDDAQAHVVSGIYKVSADFIGGSAWISITFQQTSGFGGVYLGATLYAKSNSNDDWWIESLDISTLENRQVSHFMILESNNRGRSVLENLEDTFSFKRTAWALDSGLICLSAGLAKNLSVSYATLELHEDETATKPVAFPTIHSSITNPIWVGSSLDLRSIKISYDSLSDWVSESILASCWNIDDAPGVFPTDLLIQVRWGKPLQMYPNYEILQRQHVSHLNLRFVDSE